MFKLEKVRYQNILYMDHLECEEGRVYAVTGPSGSGKSTLLKLLNHLLTPDEGTISFRNRELANWDPVELRRTVVMLPQQPVMFDGTIRDNLQVGLRFADKPEAGERELREALRLVHLDKPLDEETGTLSGGEKQRLSMARILLMHPDVYLLDEPTSALDRDTETAVMSGFVARARKNGQTVIMVTHSVHLAESLADRIMDVGRSFASNQTGG